VLSNLLENAWQYTPYGGKFMITTERLPDRIKMVFANTGEGIAEEDVPFIFERFYRGEKSRSREHGGAGIGLAIVKELIEAHGGGELAPRALPLRAVSGSPCLFRSVQSLQSLYHIFKVDPLHLSSNIIFFPFVSYF